MATKRIRYIGVLSAGYTGCALCLASMMIGIIVTIFYLPTIFKYGVDYKDMLPYLLGSVMSMFFYIFIYPVIGFISGVLVAVVYNFSAKFFGGLKVEIK